ncbi:HIT domain-containing protein [Bacteroidota bacterium]
MARRTRIFSPWRSEHLDDFLVNRGGIASGGAASVFTEIANSVNDRANLVLWRGESVFVVMNLYPYNNGHVLIVPYRQVARYIELWDNEQVEIARTINLVVSWIDEALEPEGYNIGINDGEAAGAGIPDHMHVHVVPRWSGDTNFMPTVADVKIVPESIDASYEKILAVVNAVSE